MTIRDTFKRANRARQEQERQWETHVRQERAEEEQRLDHQAKAIKPLLEYLSEEARRRKD